MDCEANKRLATSMILDVAAGRADEALAKLSESVRYVMYNGGEVVRTKRDMAPLFRTARESFLSMELEITSVIAEADRVAFEAKSRAVTTDGRPYVNWYHFLAVIRDGLIVEWKEYLDTKLAADAMPFVDDALRPATDDG